MNFLKSSRAEIDDYLKQATVDKNQSTSRQQSILSQPTSPSYLKQSQYPTNKSVTKSGPIKTFVKENQLHAQNTSVSTMSPAAFVKWVIAQSLHNSTGH